MSCYEIWEHIWNIMALLNFDTWWPKQRSIIFVLKLLKCPYSEIIDCKISQIIQNDCVEAENYVFSFKTSYQTLWIFRSFVCHYNEFLSVSKTIAAIVFLNNSAQIYSVKADFCGKKFKYGVKWAIVGPFNPGPTLCLPQLSPYLGLDFLRKFQEPKMKYSIHVR